MYLRSRDEPRHEKEVHLTSVDGESKFCGKYKSSSKVCRYQAYKQKKHKGSLHSRRTSNSKVGNVNNDGSNKICNFCGVECIKNPSASRRILRKNPHNGRRRM